MMTVLKTVTPRPDVVSDRDFDGKPFYVDGQEMIYSAKTNNLQNLYKTGRYMNTNVALQVVLKKVHSVFLIQT